MIRYNLNGRVSPFAIILTITFIALLVTGTSTHERDFFSDLAKSRAVTAVGNPKTLNIGN